VSKVGLGRRRAQRHREATKAGGHTAEDIAKYLGVSWATLYRYLSDEAVA
jgi:AcrR family transcriptional regulator